MSDGSVVLNDISGPGLLHFLTHQALRSRSTWRATLISGVVTPVFFLLALGLGLGSLVTETSALGTTDYLEFVGPGLLATAAMQQGGQQGLWPTLGALKWEGNYQAALLTPLNTAELATGHILWIGARILTSSALFTLVLAGFGVADSPWAVLAPLAATLTGLGFAAPISAFAATRDSDLSFSIIIRALLFLFLFSGAFFPIDQLPVVLQWLARITPIWHGVEVCRALISGRPGASDLLHLTYLTATVLIGWRLAMVTFQRRLAP